MWRDSLSVGEIHQIVQIVRQKRYIISENIKKDYQRYKKIKIAGRILWVTGTVINVTALLACFTLFIQYTIVGKDTSTTFIDKEFMFPANGLIINTIVILYSLLPFAIGIAMHIYGDRKMKKVESTLGVKQFALGPQVFPNGGGIAISFRF